MRRHLVLAGSGHAHLEVLAHLDEYVRRDCDVTLISPDIFWYSGMGPGVLSEIYDSEEHQIDTAELAREKGGAHIQDEVARIDPASKALHLKGGRRVGYDLLSVNVGSEVPAAMIDGADGFGWTVKPIANLTRLRNAVRISAGSNNRLRLVIAGGGAAGCEVAINLCHLIRRHGSRPEIRIITPGPALMEKEGAKPGRGVARELERLGVTVMLGQKVVRATRDQVFLDDGSALACDFFIVATGIQPPSLFRESKLPTARDGSLLVNSHLQSVAAPEIFGAGDCIGFADGPPPRVGVYAVRESKILHHNLLAALDGRKLRRFHPRKSYLLILNLGDGRGLLFWRGHAWQGAWAFRLKNFLDCGFIKKYRQK